MPCLARAGVLAGTLLACLPAESQDIPVRIAQDIAATFGSGDSEAGAAGGEDGLHSPEAGTVDKTDPAFAEPWDEPDWMIPPVEQDFTTPRSTMPIGPTFTVLNVDNSYYRCCPSPLFRLMMQALKAHPLHRADPKDAEAIFFYHDTLRMCEWPHLALKQSGKGKHDLGCVDAGGDSHNGQSFVHSKDSHHSCDWCCKGAPDLFISSMEQVIKQYGKIHTFVYWKNSGDNFFKCHEFKGLYERLKGMPVRYVGFQLQKSQFDADDAVVQEFGIGGINMLVPLFPAHYAMPEADSFRDLCVPDRPWLASFSGQLGYSPIRNEVFKLEDKHPRFHIYRTDKFGGEDPEGYEQILRHSIFGFVPRGDEHYTFRLTEVLAAGAVPVMIDDDFVSLYGSDDMSSWAVILKESEVHTAPEVLDAISPEKACAMKKRGTELFHFAQDVGHTVDGILTGLWKTRPGQSTVPPSTSATETTTTVATTTTPEKVETAPEKIDKVENVEKDQSAAHEQSDSIASMNFSVLDEDDSKACCTTPFFQEMLDAMHSHPDYASNPNEAHAIFLRHDSLRLCAWPDEAHDQCEAANEDEGDRDCGKCCSTSTGSFLEATRSAVEKYGKNHTFVYFKNVQDDRESCSEFKEAKAETSKLGIDVRFVGFNLHKSEMSEKGADGDMWDYPLPGVNLLAPLPPKRAAIEEPKDTRGDCVARKYMASFCGPKGASDIWDEVQKLAGAEAFKIDEGEFCGGEDQKAYGDVLRDSVFGIVPKGSEHYSYRLTEVIAAGAVPVIIDDDFVAPYALGDKEKWAVIVPEAAVSKVPDTLASYANESICEMKKKGAGLMHFARTVESTVDGLLFGLRLTAAGSQAKTAWIQGRAFDKDGSLMVSANAAGRTTTTAGHAVLFVSGDKADDSSSDNSSDNSSDTVKTVLVYLSIIAGVLLMAAIIGALFGAGFGGQGLSNLVRGNESKGALGLGGNGQYEAAPEDPSHGPPPRGLQALFGDWMTGKRRAGNSQELTVGCAETAHGAMAGCQRVVTWARTGCQAQGEGSESLLRGDGEVEMASDEVDDGAVWVCLNCAAVNKASQMVCSRPGCQIRQGPRPPPRSRNIFAKREDRPDPFWENRNGQVSVPGLGLIDDNLSVDNQTPSTLNRQGEAQARGNTAMLIASSISKAVKQASQGERERHGQRQEAKSMAPHVPVRQQETVLGEEDRTWNAMQHQTSASAASRAEASAAQSRAARSVSQIAATSRNASRS